MKRRTLFTHVGAVAALVSIWVLFWGEISTGNVTSGIAVAVALLIAFPLGSVEQVEHKVHLIGVVRLVAFFSGELVRSSLLVARDILRGPSAVRTGIVSCPLRVDAVGLVTLLANLIALSPGTMVIDVTHDPTVLHLHVLRLDHPDAVRARVSRLEGLAVAAYGAQQSLEAVAQGDSAR